METTSIKNIRQVRDEIREKIKSVNFSVNKSNTYGSENEYLYKGLIGGLDNLLIDITTLTKAPNKFLAISTYDERNNIYSYLHNINLYFETPNNYIPSFEQLKIVIRNYGVRHSSDRQVEFENEVGNITRMKLQVQEELEEIKKFKDTIESDSKYINEKVETNKDKLSEVETELEKITKRRDDLIEASDALQAYNEEIASAKEKTDKNLELISKSLNESKSNEKLITSFASKIQEREKKLEELEFATETNSKKLKEYETERINILEDAKNLIDTAKQALNYKTAEGISASFQVQYEKANNRWILASWLSGAITCLIITTLVGIWIVSTIPDDVLILVARISLLPLPVIGAIFCANQFVKQKNIIEDYAYKMVLAKSIVGFSEQLKKNCSENNDEYIHYIKTALEEIHRDPLRKRGNFKNSNISSPNLTQVGDLVEKLSKIIKPE